MIICPSKCPTDLDEKKVCKICVIFGVETRAELNQKERDCFFLNISPEHFQDASFRLTNVHMAHIDYNKTSAEFKSKASDIAIVYWHSSLPIKMRELKVQPICLPETGVINNQTEYAMMSGWGQTALPIETELAIGWVKVLAAFKNESDYNSYLILARLTPYPGGTGSCLVSIVEDRVSDSRSDHGSRGGGGVVEVLPKFFRGGLGT